MSVPTAPSSASVATATVGVPSQSAPSRQVAVAVDGATMVVPCPLWCAHPHNEEYRSLADVWHEGREASLAVPGSPEQAIGAQITSWPYAGDPSTASAYMSVFVMGADYLEVTPAQAIAFSDQMVACAADMRSMAESVSD